MGLQIALTISKGTSYADLVSFDQGVPSSFQIQNSSSESVSLYWVDRSGKEFLYSFLAPGQHTFQPTLSTNLWRIRDASQMQLADFFADVDVVNWTGTSLISYKEQESFLRTDSGIYSTIYGYGLINVEKALEIDLPDALPSQLIVGNEATRKAIKAYGIDTSKFSGDGIIVAVVDTGINANHPELQGRVITGYDFGSNDADPSPTSTGATDHGTSVAGIIAASEKVMGSDVRDIVGIAPAAKILNIKDANENGLSNDEWLIQSFHYAVDHGARVISLSQGHLGDEIDPDLVDAAKYAISKGALIVIAAGNHSYYNTSTIPNMLKDLDVLIVGNWSLSLAQMFVDSNAAGDVAKNYVIAPSSGWTTNAAGGYIYLENGGTSCATPYVSGLAALLFQQHPDWTPKQVIERITSTATMTSPNFTGLVEHDLWLDPAGVMRGSKLADTLVALINGESIVGMGGDDSIFGSAGNDTLDGGSGMDVVNFGGPRSLYSIRKVNDVYTVTDATGHEGVDVLHDVESIRFLDKTVNLTIADNARTISSADLCLLEELYVAFFNRIPEADGLEYWISQRRDGKSINVIADVFYTAAVEYSSLTGYTSGMQDDDFVRLIYKNVLGRTGATAPADDDVTYWAGQLENGIATKGALVSTMLASAHSFKGNATWGWVPDLLDNKITVANYFSVQQGLNYNSPQESVTNGMAIAALITSTDMAAAIKLIGVSEEMFVAA